MSKSYKIAKVIFIFFCLILIFEAGALTERFLSKNISKRSQNTFEFRRFYHLSEALEIIDKCYIKDIFTDQELIKIYHSIIETVVETLDPYSHFFKSADYIIQAPVPIISEIINNNIGYIKIPNFMDANRDNEVKKAIKELKRKHIKGLIIDLRNNTGGITNMAVNIADLFLEKDKPLVSFLYREKEVVLKTETGTLFKKPIVILVNGMTASASEIISGCLQSHKRATLIGTRTYGKGVAQIDFRFNDDSVLRLTVTKYYLPNGFCPENCGLIPDIIVKDRDAQLQKAIEILEK